MDYTLDNSPDSPNAAAVAELISTNEKLVKELSENSIKLNQIKALARHFREQDSSKEKQIYELNVSVIM